MPELPSETTTRPSEPLEPTIGRRLFFVWCALWAGLMTVISAVGSITHQAISRDIGVFRRWSRFWARSMFFGIGFSVRPILRTRLDPDQVYVFAANHQVALDIPAASLAIPTPFGWVAKGELAGTPVLGRAIKASPSVFLDKSSPRRSVESMRLAGARIRDGLSVIIFPEGARSYEQKLQPFKRGAFMLAVEAGVPVVPVTILNAYRHFDEKRKLAQPGTIEVAIGEPVSMEGVTRKQIPEIMETVRLAMQREIDEWNRRSSLP
ncbi:MAG: 1-acyl-sn-glycerol-3-phosphate acyltransferase [Rhodothermales bacterium]|nr:1-acyl-sn-glycerol-3-phosphate acyltransferase [Rhodothermales bacterium]